MLIESLKKFKIFNAEKKVSDSILNPYFVDLHLDISI